jgi:hypothetical protein
MGQDSEGTSEEERHKEEEARFPVEEGNGENLRAVTLSINSIPDPLFHSVDPS